MPPTDTDGHVTCTLASMSSAGVRVLDDQPRKRARDSKESLATLSSLASEDEPTSGGGGQHLLQTRSPTDSDLSPTSNRLNALWISPTSDEHAGTQASNGSARHGPVRHERLLSRLEELRNLPHHTVDHDWRAPLRKSLLNPHSAAGELHLPQNALPPCSTHSSSLDSTSATQTLQLPSISPPALLTARASLSQEPRVTPLVSKQAAVSGFRRVLEPNSTTSGKTPRRLAILSPTLRF